MNRNMINMGTLAIVCLFSVSALAAGVAVKERPSEQVDVKARPGAEMTTVKPTTGSNVLNFTGAQVGKKVVPAPAQAAANDNQPQGASCSKTDFASQLSKDTGVSYADALAVVNANLVTMGTCNPNGGGVISFEMAARKHLLVAGVHVLNNGGAQLKGDALDKLWAEGLSIAKNADATDASQKTTPEQELAVATQIKNSCHLRN